MRVLLLQTPRVAIASLLLASLASCAGGPDARDRGAVDDPGAVVDARLDWWRDARFGMFIHWGLYAVPAGEWNGETRHAEWIRTTAQIPLETYDEFVDDFDPFRFDADAWARAARDAGMRYMVITTKHHDGFCLFDSTETEFDVMATPFRRDILRELTAACRRHGIRIGWYHSIMDWHHPDYLPRRGWETDRSTEGADFDRYVRTLHAQVTELLTNYGTIDVMWFDGEWERTWNHERGQALYDLCRSLQPDIIVNNRVDVGRGGMAGFSDEGKYAGDFGTPEQEVPATGFPGVDWESCITMNAHWGYNRADRNYKSTEQLIHMLVDIVSKGGNLLLNVGPKADGTFPTESLVRLAEIGDWMDRNASSIRGALASPFDETPWGRCTMRRDEEQTLLYLHVFDWPAGPLVVDGLGNREIRARLLAPPATSVAVVSKIDGDGNEVRTVELPEISLWESRGSLPVTAVDGRVTIELPEECPDPIDTVVVLEFEGEPIIYAPPRIEAPSNVLVDELSVVLDCGSPALAIRFTTDGSTPNRSSSLYRQPIHLTDSTVLRARAFHDGRAVTATVERRFKRVEPQPGAPVGDRTQGLRRTIHAGDWDQLPDFDVAPASRTEIVSTVTLAGGAGAEYQGARFEGWLTVPESAVYRFVLDSDDGSRLWIGNTLVIDNDGLHGPRALEGVIPLGVGAHPIRVEYFNKTGGAELDLRLGRAGEPAVPVAKSVLSH